jgi:GNAT superfamily N-acetyltransferase
VSIAERPDLWDPMGDFNMSVWPAFMLEDEVANRLWSRLRTDWGEFQLCLVDAAGAIAAAHNSAPLAWDGTEEDLPDGWDAQFERSVAGRDAGHPPNTLGALQIVVDPARQGSGLAGVMLEAMRANAMAHGFGAVIACVRPTWKERYPLTPLERYAAWKRDDDLPFDPWIRLHVRLGGQLVKPSPRSMTIRAPVADWERWSELAFPDSGDYVVPGGAAVVHVDRERDEAVYHDPNVWIVHPL